MGLVLFIQRADVMLYLAIYLLIPIFLLFLRAYLSPISLAVGKTVLMGIKSFCDLICTRNDAQKEKSQKESINTISTGYQHKGGSCTG